MKKFCCFVGACEGCSACIESECLKTDGRPTLKNIKTIPDWCPLPDVMHHQEKIVKPAAWYNPAKDSYIYHCHKCGAVSQHKAPAESSCPICEQRMSLISEPGDKTNG